ncbi:uncharacterized protein LOC141729243 [Zonotrichia albicollis]|uniref:uncharacterized protein LOC141729243 n=1 Tax=Zonotrichia albicollis TaxID=44394 RepID=UPI003D80C79B
METSPQAHQRAPPNCGGAASTDTALPARGRPQGARRPGTTLTLQRRLLVPNSYEFNHIPPGITGAGWGLTPEYNGSETTSKQAQVKGRVRSLPWCCRRTCGGSGRPTKRRAAKGEPRPRAPSAARGAGENGIFPGIGGGRLCGSSPRCAPSAPAQLRWDLRGFCKGDRAWPAHIEQKPFREQATKSRESRRGRVAREPPSPGYATSGHGGGSAAAAVTLPAAFETSPAAAGSCPDFLPLPAARRREIRLFVGQRGIFRPRGAGSLRRGAEDAFSFFNRTGPGGVSRSHRRASPVGSRLTRAWSGGAFAPHAPLRPLPSPWAGTATSSGTRGPGGSASRPHPCPLRDRAPAAPSLSHAYLSGPAAEGLPPPAPAPRPGSAIPAAGVSHAAAPAQPRLSPCAHSAGAGSPAGFMRGQRRLRAAARLAANAAARLTLPRPGVTHGGSRRVADPRAERRAGTSGPALRPLPRAPRAARRTPAPSPTPCASAKWNKRPGFRQTFTLPTPNGRPPPSRPAPLWQAGRGPSPRPAALPAAPAPTILSSFTGIFMESEPEPWQIKTLWIFSPKRTRLTDLNSY